MFTYINKLKQMANDTFANKVVTYNLIVPKSNLDKAQILESQGKLKRIRHLNGQEYYLELTNNECNNNEFNLELRIWPKKWGYDGRNDGHVLMTNNIENMIVGVIEMIVGGLINDFAKYEINYDK